MFTPSPWLALPVTALLLTCGLNACDARGPRATFEAGAVIRDASTPFMDAESSVDASPASERIVRDATLAQEAAVLGDAEASSDVLSDEGGTDASASQPPVRFACAEEAWKLQRVGVGELTLEVACRSAPPAQGPLAILLHGYPESHLAWNALASRLVAQGFVVVAPNQRGYAGSDKPTAVDAYRVEHAAQDLLGVLNASGRQRMLLVGHDWGGLVAFLFAHRHPERVQGLVVMNAPHPDIWGQREVDPVQADATDGYVPLIMGPLGFVTPFYLDFSLSSHLTPDELAQYRAQWNQPDAFARMNQWYAANLHPDVKFPRGITVDRPTLAIWGMADTFVMPSQLEHLPRYVPSLEIVRLDGVDHWVTHQRTDEIAQRIQQFYARLP